MPSFFANLPAQLTDYRSILADYETQGTLFNLDDRQHVQLVSNCTQLVRDKLQNLHRIDKNITSGLAVGSAAFILSYLLPFGLVAIAGFAYSAYHFGQRQNAYAEYNSALENLAGSCVWTFNGLEDMQKLNAIIDNENIQLMMGTLAPLTNEDQIRTFVDDDKVERCIAEMKRFKQDVTFHDYPIDPDKYFKMYGYEQGHTLSVLGGIVYAIQTGFRALKEAFNSEPAHGM